MQISGPRGRKSLPTRASRTLDLPLLWLPTTATCGRSSLNSALACGAQRFSPGLTAHLLLPRQYRCNQQPGFCRSGYPLDATMT